MQPTWILVADRARARLFTPNADGDALDELKDFVNPEGRKPEQAYSYDRPPRTMDSMGPARHAIEPRTTSEEKVAARFAHELNDVLERGRVDHSYERLILAAPPRFLGVLQKALGKQVRSCVVAQVDKDLSTLPAREIQQTLAPQIGH
ncbi:MAG: host attachment protein [Arenimonas sp.]|jgi:protein required for attachment to host cells